MSKTTHLHAAQDGLDAAITNLTSAQRNMLYAMAHETNDFSWPGWTEALGAIHIARKSVEAMDVIDRATVAAQEQETGR